MQCGGWNIVYVKTKTENTVAWFVCKIFARRGRDEGVQQKELCVQQREVNDVACYFSGNPYVHVNPRLYVFSIFLSCTSTQKKIAHRREPQKKKITCVHPHTKKSTWKGVLHRRRQHVRSGQ